MRVLQDIPDRQCFPVSWYDLRDFRAPGVFFFFDSLALLPSSWACFPFHHGAELTFSSWRLLVFQGLAFFLLRVHSSTRPARHMAGRDRTMKTGFAKMSRAWSPLKIWRCEAIADVSPNHWTSEAHDATGRKGVAPVESVRSTLDLGGRTRMKYSEASASGSSGFFPPTRGVWASSCGSTVVPSMVITPNNWG